MKFIILTGGSGYIGSAIAHRALESGFGVINIDKVGPDYRFKPDDPNYTMIIQDLRSLGNFDLTAIMNEVYEAVKGNSLAGLIDLAAYKDLTESYDNPRDYYDNNLRSLLSALDIARVTGCPKFIFSSSAAVYDDDASGAISEDFRASGPSPYGYTKLIGERIVHDICKQYKIKSYCLRYQNPVGSYKGITADESTSMFGNIVNSIKNNTTFTIFGGNYDTPDGTCIRDYIDVLDLADIHLKFISYSFGGHLNNQTINVGRGVPLTCLEVCKIVKKLYPKFNYEIGNPRPGDADGSYANTDFLNISYGFKTTRDISDTIKGIINYAKSSEDGKNKS